MVDLFTTNWSTWDAAGLNTLVHPASGLALRFVFYEPALQRRYDNLKFGRELKSLGPHAVDGSYSLVRFDLEGTEITLEAAAAGSRLAVKVAAASGSPWLALVEAFWRWGHAGSLTPDGGGFLAGVGGETWRIAVDGGPAAIAYDPSRAVHRALRLERPVTVTVNLEPDEAESFLSAKRAACAAGEMDGDGLGAGIAPMMRSLVWNTVWEPVKGRFCSPVSRNWCNEAGEGFGTYVLFDWDTFFAAMIAGAASSELAEANVRAILDEVTPRGFVPNFGSARGSSLDRSQPPVGAYCVWKLFAQHGMKNLLGETYDRLLRWHDWWFTARDGDGNGLLEWGSDPVGTTLWPGGDLQGAMFESGLDNSPMYDGVAYDAVTHTMELDDVGLNALYALDAWALSRIAGTLGREEDAARLLEEYRHLADRINDLLWDEAAGIYKNRHWDGRLSPVLSPTNFYPLLAGVVPSDRARRMVREHLLNPGEFWGDLVIPSVARNHPAYHDNDYWRGRIWGPMNFLVCEGVRRAGFDAEAAEFAARSLRLLLKEWREESHVHENYNAETGEGDDVRNADPVYHWGGLLGYIALQDLIDIEPWGGLRLGTLHPDGGEVRGYRTGEARYDLSCNTRGLAVKRDGEAVLQADVPMIVRLMPSYRDVRHVTIKAERRGTLALVLPPGCSGVDLSVNGREFGWTAGTGGRLEIEVEGPEAVRA